MKHDTNPLPSMADSLKTACDSLNDLDSAIGSMKDSLNSAINDLGDPPLPVAKGNIWQRVIPSEEKTRSITAVLTYYESVRYPVQAVALWPSTSIAYEMIWAKRFAQGLVYAWGKMDYATRARYLALASEYKTQSERS